MNGNQASLFHSEPDDYLVPEMQSLFPHIEMEKAILCAELSHACYRYSTPVYSNKKSWNVEAEKSSKIAKIFGFDAITLSSPTQQCVIYHNDHEIIVAFEGTHYGHRTHHYRNLASYALNSFDKAPETVEKLGSDILKAMSDQELAKHQLSPEKRDELIDTGATYHHGFNRALDDLLVHGLEAPATITSKSTLWEGIKETLNALQKQKPRSTYFTGHSAGGAIAAITLTRCAQELPTLPIAGLYSYGAPRFCNKVAQIGLGNLRNQEQTALKDIFFRFDQEGDPVVAIPPHDPVDFKYVHCGSWIPMNSNGEMLDMQDASILEDTLSHSNPEQYKTWQARFKRLAEIIDKHAPDRFKPYDFTQKEKVSPAIKQSIASARDTLIINNYKGHAIINYANAILKYIKTHNGPTASRILTDVQGSGLYQEMRSLRDNIEQLFNDHDRGKTILIDNKETALIPEKAKPLLQSLREVLNGIITEWDTLREHPPREIKAKILGLADAVEKTQKEQALITRLFWARAPDEETIHEMVKQREENGSHHVEQHIRSNQRISNVDKLQTELLQFEYDIALHLADNPKNEFLKRISEKVESCYHSTKAYESQIGITEANTR